MASQSACLARWSDDRRGTGYSQSEVVSLSWIARCQSWLTGRIYTTATLRVAQAAATRRRPLGEATVRHLSGWAVWAGRASSRALPCEGGGPCGCERRDGVCQRRLRPAPPLRTCPRVELLGGPPA